MTSHITSGHAITLGPFLTLLVMTASGGTSATRSRLATVATAPLEVLGARTECGRENRRTRRHPIALGPFFTLILTLHRRTGSRSDNWPLSSGAGEAASLVRFHVAT